MVSDCPPGFAFLLNGHLWVVVACSSSSPNEVLIVYLTTKRQDSDITVILQPGDHDFIRRETVVSYADARIMKKENLINRINSRDFELREPFSADKIQLIQNGILKSPFAAKDKIEFYNKTNQ
jgi:hypothetical protein